MISQLKIMCYECNKQVDSCFKYNMKEYRYRYNRKYFCCYNCYNKYLTQLEQKLKMFSGALV